MEIDKDKNITLQQRIITILGSYIIKMKERRELDESIQADKKLSSVRENS